jgi:hypothetical protein
MVDNLIHFHETFGFDVEDNFDLCMIMQDDKTWIKCFLYDTKPCATAKFYRWSSFGSIGAKTVDSKDIDINYLLTTVISFNEIMREKGELEFNSRKWVVKYKVIPYIWKLNILHKIFFKKELL